MTQERGIKVCAHVILGLLETHEEVMQTARELARLRVDGVKIHMLCVLENTKLADSLLTTHHSLLSEDEYVALVCDFLEQLPPDIIVHRLAASGFSKTLIAPKWVNNKFSTLNKICNNLLTK
jgi:radical SAM protein (TIGR01212 family)